MVSLVIKDKLTRSHIAVASEGGENICFLFFLAEAGCFRFALNTSLQEQSE